SPIIFSGREAVKSSHVSNSLSKIRRKRVARANCRREWAQEMLDAVRVVAHELTGARQNDVSATFGDQNVAHVQHAPRAVEGLRDVPLVTNHAAIELEQRVAHLAHTLEQVGPRNEIAVKALNRGTRERHGRHGNEGANSRHHSITQRLNPRETLRLRQLEQRRILFEPIVQRDWY